MPSYDFDHLDAVTRRIADLGLAVSAEGHPADDGTMHYPCSIGHRNEPLDFSVRQPQGAGTPDVCDAMQQLVEDSCLADRGIDTFAKERGITLPSIAVYQFDRAKKTLDYLTDKCYLSRFDLLELRATLGDHPDAVREGVAAIMAERQAERERTHPEVPEGFVTIESLQDDLDLGDWGDQCTEYDADDIGDRFGDVADGNIDIYFHDLLKWLPDNYEWIEEAEAQGLLEGAKGDLIKMTQMGQYVCFTQDMYDHKEDIVRHVTLETLKDAGVYAVSQELADALDTDVDYAGADTFDEALDEAKEQVQNVMAANLEGTLGDEGLAQEAADQLVGDDDYGIVNPAALSVEAVHVVNEKGYDAALAECEFWKDYKREQDASEAERPTLSEMNRQCCEARSALAQDCPERETEPQDR